MFARALANRLARRGVHLALARPMIARLLVANLVVPFLVDKPEDVGLAGFACLIATAAVSLTGRMQGARKPPVEAQA